MEISAFAIYLFTRLDKILSACNGLCVVCAGLTVLSSMFSVAAKADKKTTELEVLSQIFTKFPVKSIPFMILVISGILWLIVPNQKEFAAIYIIPKVVNNERVQKIGGDIMDIGDSLIKLSNEYIQENFKPLKKKENEIN